jgi:uncharacterized repeat protein (TIGR01451 family)
MVISKAGSSPLLRGISMLAIGISLCFSAMAQGWEANFGGNKYDEGRAVVEAIDGGYVMVGFSESFSPSNNLDVYVVRTDIDGRVLWTMTYDEGFMEHGFNILSEEDGTFVIVGDIARQAGAPLNVLLMRITKEGKPLWVRSYPSSFREVGKDVAKTADGGYIVVGSADTPNKGVEALLLKVDANGNLQWRETYGAIGDDHGEAVVALEDGYAFVGSSDNPNGFDNDIILYRVNKGGEVVWDRRYATPQADEGYDLVRTRDNGLALVGLTGDNSQAFIAKYDINGNLLWTNEVGGDLGDVAYSVMELADGSLVIAGQTETSPTNIDIFIAKFDKEGKSLWTSIIGDPDYIEDARDIIPTREGSFVIAGSKARVGYDLLNDIILVKTDPQGNIITNHVTGRVYHDIDGNCDGFNPTRDVPLKGWLVRVDNKDRTYYGATDEEGFFRIRVDTGLYTVEALRANGYWESCLASGYEVALTEFYDSVDLQFPMRSGIACPYMEVDVSTPFLAPCTDIVYTVAYCNLGTATGLAAYVEVTLDEKLTFLSSSVPVSRQEGNVYTFNLGNVPSTRCGNFTINTRMACSGIAQGQAGLVKAHIFPDTLCFPPDPNWDGSSVIVTGQCAEQRDSVEFTVKNVGQGPMDMPREAIVIEDDLVLFRVPYNLRAGDARQIKLDASKGATYRVIAEQSPFHPGRTFPTAFVEACTEPGNTYVTGKVTMFPEDDLLSAVAIDVREISGPPPAVHLTGHPKGYQDSVLAQNADITFTVFFRNTGIDTITRVVIRDTLSRHLDIATLTPGASSHPYDFEIYDNGILKITFPEIQLLPGGGADGRGFVKFRVSQKPSNPVGTIIENRAAVFFDYHPIAFTNQVRYFIDEYPSYVKISTSAREVFWPGVKINVYPNPFMESTVFEIGGHMFNEVSLQLFDSSGRLIRADRYRGNQFVVHRRQLPSGVYMYRLESEGKLINTGKFLVR